MPTESERKDTRKAMAFELICILDKTPERTYTTEEVKQLIIALTMNDS